MNINVRCSSSFLIAKLAEYPAVSAQDLPHQIINLFSVNYRALCSQTSIDKGNHQNRTDKRNKTFFSCPQKALFVYNNSILSAVRSFCLGLQFSHFKVEAIFFLFITEILTILSICLDLCLTNKETLRGRTLLNLKYSKNKKDTIFFLFLFQINVYPNGSLKLVTQNRNIRPRKVSL